MAVQRLRKKGLYIIMKGYQTLVLGVLNGFFLDILKQPCGASSMNNFWEILPARMDSTKHPERRDMSQAIRIG